MKNLGILDLLDRYGFDSKNTKAKMVRHKHNTYPIEELLRNDWLEIYQAYQSKPVFSKVSSIVSFYGLPGIKACLYGVFNVKGILDPKKVPLEARCPWTTEWRKNNNFYYQLERAKGFEELEHRLVIDWDNPIAWHQHKKNMPIVEIFAEGRKQQVFEDYLEFSLTFSQLKELFETQEAHRDWRSRLEAVAGVYLILAENTGHIYIGSAYGSRGIWGRWETYSKTGHGGNKQLIELLKSDSDYPRGFRFSILQILPKTFTKQEVIKREIFFKTKLGSRATGLNSN